MIKFLILSARCPAGVHLESLIGCLFVGISSRISLFWAPYFKAVATIFYSVWFTDPTLSAEKKILFRFFYIFFVLILSFFFLF